MENPLVKTASDILSLSAHVHMPPFQWSYMRPRCRTCERLRLNDRIEGDWPWSRFSRGTLCALGAQELNFGDGGVSLVIPMHLLWPEKEGEPFHGYHEIFPEWDHRLLGDEGFIVQDLTRFKGLKPLSETSFSRLSRR